MSNDAEINAKIDHRKHIYLLLQNVDRIFEILGSIYIMMKRKKEKNISQTYVRFYEKISKIFMLILTLMLIAFVYYFYVYV
jgi:hypothetical protein